LKDIEIRPATDADGDAMWEIFRVLVANGDTYSFGAGTTREACNAYWFGPGVRSFVAIMHSAGEGGRLLGMYKLVANHPDHGAHVANASFMVDPSAQGVGIGKMLGEHCLDEARRAGYLAMQFNFVVSTNGAAVALWNRLGFEIVGTLPKAYRHAQLGYVDAYVMYRELSDSADWPA
jgi:ribosomal protein S18 acetylase RimI-like enzyme